MPQHHRIGPDYDALALHARGRALLSIDEAAIVLLRDELNRGEGTIPAWLVKRMEQAIRGHRVAIIKHRAIMAALGIDV